MSELRNFGTNWPAVWVKMASSWVCIIVYVWTLYVPTCIPGRDFSLVNMTTLSRRKKKHIPQVLCFFYVYLFSSILCQLYVTVILQNKDTPQICDINYSPILARRILLLADTSIMPFDMYEYIVTEMLSIKNRFHTYLGNIQTSPI